MSVAPEIHACVQYEPPCAWRPAPAPPPAALAELSERLRRGGPACLDDEDALRLACGASAADAAALLAEFGSLPEVLAAPCAALARIVSGTQAAKLALAHDLARRLLERPLRRRSALSSWTAVADYLRGVLAGRPREQFRVLFLDRKNQLIRDEVMGEGTVDHAPVYPREVLRRALELNASALILAHKSPMAYLVLNGIGVLIFAGLIAADTQRLRNIYYTTQDPEALEASANYGALTLYLNFITLFELLLSFSGGRRRR